MSGEIPFSLESMGDFNRARVVSVERGRGNFGLILPSGDIRIRGTGKALHDSDVLVRQIYEDAAEVLGYSLTHISFGEEEDSLYLKDPAFGQPAVFVGTHAYCETMKRGGQRLEMLTGEGVGLWNTVVTAGAASFKDILKVVQVRAENIRGISDSGKMVSLTFPLDADRKRKSFFKQEMDVLEQNGLYVGVVISKNRVVASGLNRNFRESEKFLDELRAAGVIIEDWNSDGPSHTKYMKPVKEAVKKELDKIKISGIKIPVVLSPVTARPISSPEEIREALLDELDHPFRFDQITAQLRKHGIFSPMELGGNAVSVVRENPGKTALVAVTATAGVVVLLRHLYGRYSKKS